LKVSVIVASLPSRNPGMIAVNQAFRTIQRELPGDTTVTYYEAGTRHIANDGTLELLGSLGSAFDSDRVVFWGDFLHMRRYHIDLARGVAKSGQPATRAALEAEGDPVEYVRNHLLLSTLPAESRARAVLVGGTLALNSSLDYADTDYAGGLAQLLGDAKRVLMRDAYSAAVASLHRGGRDATLGCDCALMMSPRQTNDTAVMNAKVRTCAVFFGRNAGSYGDMGLTLEVCNHMGARPIWLPWLVRSHSKMRHLGFGLRYGRIPRVEVPDADPLGAAVETIVGSDFVVTDTYHLSVVAWALGVPAVCIADTTEAVAESVNSGTRGRWRDKRYEFYSMIDGLAFFVHAGELRNRRTRTHRLKLLLSALQPTSPEQAVVLSRVDALRRQVTRQVTDALSVNG
jgi:hypothetical protein